MREKIKRALSNLTVKWAATAVIAFLAVAIYVYWEIYAEKLVYSNKTLFWLEVFTGNWSSSRADFGTTYTGHVGPKTFLAGTIIAIILSILPIFGIFAALWRLTIGKRKVQMEIGAAFLVKEATILATIFSKLSADERKSLRPIITAAFKEGSAVWEREELPNLIGPEQAKSFLAALKNKTSDMIPH